MSDTQKSGKIKCGACGKNVVNGKWLPTMFFCPDALCINSEELYLD